MGNPAVNPSPVYSHGGSAVVGWPAVAGTAISAGRPIKVYGSEQPYHLNIVCLAGTATVQIEVNSGAVSATGVPPSAEWVDITFGGLVMDSSDSYASSFVVELEPFQFYIRTKITAISGSGSVVSYIPSLICNERTVSPSYPTLSNATTGV